MSFLLYTYFITDVISVMLFQMITSDNELGKTRKAKIHEPQFEGKCDINLKALERNK